MKKHPDYILLGLLGFLLALGIVILASVSASFSFKKFGDTYYLLRHQILLGLIPGLVLAFLAFKINLAKIKKWIFPILLGNLLLMVLVFLPVIGSGSEKASRWIYLGSFSFQPSELLKLVFILYLATWLVSKIEKKIKDSQPFIGFVMIIGIVTLLLVLQPNISTLGVIVFTAVLMYFAINTPPWHSVLIVLLGLIALYSLIQIAPYRIERLAVFLNPETDPMGIGYQTKQALITVGAGGAGGVGLGMSVQKWGFLPESVADSIFAVFCEETGFIGGSILIFLFLIFLWRGFKIAKGTPDKFSQLTAVGITSWITIQAFVNIGAMIGLLPLTGIPLPFVSYGGSALIIELAGAGILLNISKNSQ
ncbi:MAG: putative lipid II flippase FtsW [Candidatus Pacebacteria bacterium]|nr:putative lipid II flippase FtsW [Candidatus Paceibacterota bacterium]